MPSGVIGVQIRRNGNSADEMEFIFVIKSCTIKVPIPVTNGVDMEVPDIAL